MASRIIATVVTMLIIVLASPNVFSNATVVEAAPSNGTNTVKIMGPDVRPQPGLVAHPPSITTMTTTQAPTSRAKDNASNVGEPGNLTNFVKIVGPDVKPQPGLVAHPPSSITMTTTQAPTTTEEDNVGSNSTSWISIVIGCMVVPSIAIGGWLIWKRVWVADFGKTSCQGSRRFFSGIYRAGKYDVNPEPKVSVPSTESYDQIPYEDAEI